MATATPPLILEALHALAEQFSVTVCYEPMTGTASGTGGLCRVRGQYRVIIDRRLGPRERVQVLAAALARFDLSGVALPDVLRPLFPPPAALAG